MASKNCACDEPIMLCKIYAAEESSSISIAATICGMSMVSTSAFCACFMAKDIICVNCSDPSME